MNVLLLRRLKNHKPGDVIFVKNGYAKYLLNSQMAVYPSEENKKKIDAELEKIKLMDEERNSKYISIAAKINALPIITITRNANDSGNLYGSIAPKDIVDLLNEHKIFVDLKYIKRSNINKVGEHVVHIVFPITEATFKLMIDKIVEEE